MKKYSLLLIFLFFVNCSGYEPIFSSKNFNYSIDEIIFDENDKISRNISKKLINFSTQNKEKIKLKINSEEAEIILSKDKKGNPSIFEISISTNIEVLFQDSQKKIFKYNEKFSFNTQKNKFELNQYRNTIKDNLTNKIFDQIILQLRLI